jgi:hypothetical protein
MEGWPILTASPHPGPLPPGGRGRSLSPRPERSGKQRSSRRADQDRRGSSGNNASSSQSPPGRDRGRASPLATSARAPARPQVSTPDPGRPLRGGLSLPRGVRRSRSRRSHPRYVPRVRRRAGGLVVDATPLPRSGRGAGGEGTQDGRGGLGGRRARIGSANFNRPPNLAEICSKLAVGLRNVARSSASCAG